MKAAIINKTGGPEVIEVKDIILEKPNENEVTIEHKAIGLNYIDIYHRSGLYPLKLPTGIGAEGAGIIKEVGSNVKEFNLGDKVAYAGTPLGAYSTHRNYPTKNLVKVPDNIDLEVSATLMTRGLTTFYLLHKTYPVKSGQTILFHAAAGGVGQIFGQWAKTLGCTLIGTVGADEKIQKAKAYGYDHIINYNKENFSSNKKIRVGGLVKINSVSKNETSINFIITDLKKEIFVSYNGLVPNLFSEGKGVVAEGKLKDKKYFVADKILAKHDENYMPPEVSKALE